MAGPMDYVSQLLGGGNGQSDPFASNPNFVNPQYATPQQLASMRQYGDQLLKQPTTIHRPMQGIAEIINSYVGGNLQHQADQQQQQAYNANADATSRAFEPTQSGPGAPPAAPIGANGAPTTSPTPQASAGTISPGDVANAAMSFYQDKGLSPVASAGLAGGFANEGTPTSVNPGDGRDGSASIGVGQWNGTRAQALQQFAAAKGLNPADLRTQLEFSWQELNGPESKTLSALQAAKTPGDAAVAAAGYERPAGWTPDNPTGAQNFTSRLASTTALLGGQGGNAPGAIASAAPQAGGRPRTPPAGAMAFSGTAGGMPGSGAAMPVPAATPSAFAPAGQTMPQGGAQGGLAAGLMNYQGGQPTQTDPTHPIATALIAQGGPPPQQPSQRSRDLAQVLLSPYSTDQARNVAAGMINPTYLPGPGGSVSSIRNGQGALPVTPGLIPSTTHIGNNALPAVTTYSGGQVGPTVPLAPGAPDAGGKDTTGLPGGPYSGFNPAIAEGAAIDRTNTSAGALNDASTKEKMGDLVAATTYPDRVNALQQAIPLIDKLGPSGLGPGTPQFNQVKSAIQSLGIPGFDPDKITNYDKLKTYLQQYNSTNGGTAIAGTDTSEASLSDVAKNALALQRMKQAQIRLNANERPETYLAKKGGFLNSQDPRAYATDMMTTPQLAALDKEMPVGSPARARFAQSLKNAQASGVMGR